MKAVLKKTRVFYVRLDIADMEVFFFSCVASSCGKVDTLHIPCRERDRFFFLQHSAVGTKCVFILSGMG